MLKSTDRSAGRPRGRQHGLEAMEFLISLPAWLGGALSVLFATASGLVVYLASDRFISRYQRDELKNPIGSLFRIVGILISLMLSLAFAEAVVDVREVEKAIAREAVAISDI